MTKTDLESYRRQLMALRDRLSGDVSHLADEALNTSGDERGGDLSHVPLHMADQGTDNNERENTLNLLANEEQMLAEISAALGRIEAGTFGRCEECGSPVPRERLKELPYARHCVDCARKQDRNRS